ncbi:MAG: VOC family protein, partial [Planctomycetota bacterium]
MPVPEFTVEHIAINVPDSAAMTGWYVKNLGMTITRDVGGPSKTCFLADASGRVVLETYTNASARVPDYAAQHPLEFHLAFFVGDVKAAEDTLVAAGATVHEGYKQTPNGDEMSM